MRIRGVIFDMDGLMFDTERIGARAWRRVGAETGLDINEKLLSSMRGGSILAAADRFKEYFGDGIDYFKLRNAKIKYVNQEIAEKGLPIKKGLVELLTFLKVNNYGVALATSTNTREAMTFLEMAGLTTCFDAFVCGDMVTKSKPNPEIFNTAAEKLGFLTEECMVLEDSINGIHAAISGGFAAVIVPDLTEPDIELETKLYAKCESLLQVISLLEKNKIKL